VVVRDVRIAADSTMFLMVNLLIALSLGVHREQLEHLIGLTWPRPFLFLPLFARFLTMLGDYVGDVTGRRRKTSLAMLRSLGVGNSCPWLGEKLERNDSVS
jgi:hypothetical protein